jgi:hypothetical protein
VNVSQLLSPEVQEGAFLHIREAGPAAREQMLLLNHVFE